MAGDMVGLDLSGDRELRAFLASFPATVVKGGLRTASRKAYQPVQKAAKSKAKSYQKEADTGSRWKEIGQAITTKQKTYPRKGVVYTGVGVAWKKYAGRGRGQYQDFNPGPLAYIIEFGTAPHNIGNYLHPGAQPRPFLRPAWDENKAAAVGRMASSLRPAIEQAAQREARRRMKKYGHA